MEAGFSDTFIGKKRSQITAQSDERTIEQGGWDKVVITSVSTETDAWMQGMNVSAIAERLHLSPSDAAIEILVHNQMDVGIARHAMSESDLIAVMKYPSSTVITDGSVSVPEKGNLHPRSIGTFPRLLGTRARDEGVEHGRKPFANLHPCLREKSVSAIEEL